MTKIKSKLLAIGLSIFTMAGIFSTNAYSFVDDNEDGVETVDSKNTTSESNNVVIFTDDNFKEKISKGVVLVDFWATWCGPCRRQAPIVEELANDYKGKAKIGKLDVQNNRKIASEYYVRTIPTIIIFKDGVVMERLVGLRDKASLESTLRSYL